jgi:porin
VRARAALGDQLTFKAVVLDGVPGDPDMPAGTRVRFDAGDGLLVAGEAVLLVGGDDIWMTDPLEFRLSSRTDVEFFDARFAIGAWKYTGRFEELRSSTNPSSPPGESTANAGLYALSEWSLFKEPDDATQGLSVFGRWGIANPTINRFGSYVGLGAVYAGAFPGRDSDLLGLALASARNGNRYIDSRPDPSSIPRSETIIEATYYATIFSWLSVQADLQYVINPGTDPGLSNALVPSLRLQLGQ